ncbi:MAG TPA: TlpA disulfide reductase family protein, partial [Longimicrobiales bacterium]|nr:TlpA disulfide reductase family protein [Longimicrobiales bacterium]
KKRWYRRISLNAVGWVLVLGFLGWRVAPQLSAALGLGGAAEEAPSYSVVTLDGETVTKADLLGKVVLVNFWATWCPPCRVEMPGFQRVYDDKRDQGFVVLGLSTDQVSTDVVQRFLDERDLTFPVAMASGTVVRDFGGARVLPTSVLIDRQGRIRQRVTGIFAEPTLRMAVNRLLDEPNPFETGER